MRADEEPGQEQGHAGVDWGRGQWRMDLEQGWGQRQACEELS